MTRPVYLDLSQSCSRIDARKTTYRFDLDADVAWGRLDQRGLHFGPTLLEALGVELEDLPPPAQELFQWAFALSLCDAFYRLEDVIIRFARREGEHLGPTRSMDLLCEEELKHMELFSRYGDHLRRQRPQLARRFDELRGASAEVLPGSPEDRERYEDQASYHYGFWINTLFFEEFTIYLHDCLHLDLAIVQPTWASAHRCHWQEELQHLPTGLRHLEALDLSPKQRLTLSKVFLFGLEQGFERFFGLADAWALVEECHPEARQRPQRAFRELPIFTALLDSPAFKRTREAGPYVREVARAEARAQPATPSAPQAHLSGPPLPPLRASTLAQALRRTAREHSEQGVVYVLDDGSEARESYAELLSRAEAVAARLGQAGLAPGERAILLLSQPRDFVGVFWGCQLAGIVPAPLVAREPRLEDDTRLEAVARGLGTVSVICDSALAHASLSWAARVLDGGSLDGACLDEGAGPSAPAVSGSEHETAFLQFSSGSTGDPRGVVLTHANVLSNVEAILSHRRVTPADTMVSWMPLHHDMGLCCHTAPLVAGMNQVLLTPFLFARRPSLWLECLTRHRATITSSPNFGLSLCLRRLTSGLLERLDLSALDCILNGGEPISAPLAERFLAALAPANLAPEAMCPAYGLAEATVAVTQGRLREGLRTRDFARDSLDDPQGVRRAASDDPDAVRLVDLGVPVAGVDVQVVDAQGQGLAPGVVGEIEVRGPNVTAGYVGHPAEDPQLFRAGWLRTGDLGLVQHNRLYVAGRAKDVLFVNGRNVFASDLEEILRGIEGLTPDRLAVVGSTDPQAGAERIVAFVRHRPRSGVSREAVVAAVSGRLSSALSFPLHGVVFLRSEQFPLTSSGKVRRAVLRADFERGAFELSAPQAPAPAPTPAPRATSRQLVAEVRAIWADVLNREPEDVPTHQDFLAIGGDSLRAVEVHGCIEDQWGLLLDQRILLECRTVEEQAAFLERTLPRGDASEESAEVDVPSPPTLVRTQDVAVIAMAGRFPEAPDLDALWELLAQGRSTFREPPPDRWDVEGYYEAPGPTTTPGKTVCRTGAFLEGIREFDPQACGLPAEEARLTDPQQRVFLEVVHDLLDRAHVATSKVGVFAGAASNEYFWRHASRTERINRLSAQTNLGNMVAARVAQLLHFTGPALTIDAACATSLVAVHHAVRSLRSGECELAVAGGVQLNLTVIPHLMFSQAGVLSPRGRCQPFSREADGFVPGEGAGAVLLKPLEHALRDNDSILGVIRGSAVNNDGGALSGMAPNPAGQREVLRMAYADAGVDPVSVTYVEGHGAGTRIGDPVEVRSLSEVFCDSPPRSIGLGSVKSNVGHLFHAAGIAGLIKVLLALRHRELPPTVGCEEPAPRIRFERTPFAPVQELRPWNPPAGVPRRAGVNSFGVGGTNCHVVIDEAPAVRTEPQLGPRLLCLSAPTAEDLPRVALALAEALEARPEAELGNFCAQANQRARRFRSRRSLVCESREQALSELRGGPGSLPCRSSKRSPRLVFLFPGPGSQATGMGAHLRGQPAFDAALAECDALIAPLVGRSVADLFDADAATLERIDLAQPVIFSFGYALARWLEHLGVRGEAVLGHSAGEYVAACLAGILSLEDATRLVVERGRAMAATDAGSMAAVLAPEERVRAVIADLGEVSVACLNQPDQVVISGRPHAVERALQVLASEGVQARVLQIPCAAHSPLMIPAQEAFAPALESARNLAPQRAFFSTLIGEQLSRVAPSHWLDHLRAPVRFATAIRAALGAGYRHFVEVAPSAALSYCVQAVAERYAPGEEVSVYPLCRRSVSGWKPTLQSLGRLFSAGVELHTARLDGALRRKPLLLPPYPYRRRELWLEPPPLDLPLPPRGAAPTRAPLAPLPIDLATVPSVRDHRVYGELTAPSALLFDLVLAELVRAHPGGAGLEEVLIGRALALEPGEVRLARVREELAREGSEEGARAILETRRDEGESPWVEHLSARFLPLRRGDDWTHAPRDLEQLRARCPHTIDPERFYEHLAVGGMTYGPSLKTILELRCGEREVLVRLEARPPAGAVRTPHAFQPGLLDGALRSIGALTLPFPAADAAFLGFAVRRVAIRTPVLERCWAHVELRPDCTIDANTQAIRCDLTLLDDEGQVLAALEEVCLKRHAHVAPAAAASGEVPLIPGGERFYAVEWEPCPQPEDAETEGGSHTTSTVLVGAASPLRAALQREVEAVDGVALVVAPPGDPQSGWEGLLARLLPDPTRGYDVRFVVLEPTLERLGGLAAALIRQGVESLADFLVVSSDATLLGFVRTLAREQGEWGCRAVAVDASELSMPGLATWIHDELLAPARSLVVAYREGQRWVPRLRRVEPDAERHVLRPGGVYWITGGLGKLGSGVAVALAGRVGARILLTGRRPRADPEQLARIEAAGGEVLYVSADAADRQAMERAREAARVRWGALNGVIHAGGTVDDMPIALRVPERSRAVLRPKVEGGRVLASVVADEPLDFLVFFSSLVALSGMPGQADYAAANASLDELARVLRRRGVPATSIAWGPWRVGMAGESRYQQRYARMGLHPFSVRGGVRAFLRALESDAAHLAVVDLEARRESELLEGINRVSRRRRPAASAAPPGPQLPAAPTAPAGKAVPLADLVRRVVAGQLQTEPARVDRHAYFDDLGVDSLMAVDVVKELQRELGVRLYPTLLFEVQTLDDLIRHLESVRRKGGA